MKPLIILFLISFNALSHVEQLVEFLSGPVEGPDALLTCLTQDDEWGSDELKFGATKVQCFDDWYSKDTFYDLGYYNCRARYGKSGYVCIETDPAKLKARMNNPELMKKISSFTEYKFESYKNKLASQCCGSKSKCLERFSSTTFRIKESTNSSATYYSDSSPVGTNVIEMTTAKMASALNQENIERVLLVELAHACQFALISESPGAYQKFTTDRCSVESGRLMFREGLGEELGACVDQELQSQMAAIPESEKGKYCFGKWYREAFSDMKFRTEFTSVYHWTYDFMRRSKATNYASVYKYIKCGISPQFKAQICK